MGFSIITGFTRNFINMGFQLVCGVLRLLNSTKNAKIINMGKSYKINTYGCQMNVHESEKIAGVLEKLGYSQTEADEDADIIVFNTCCIRDTAEKRAYGNIGALKPLKKQKKDLIIAVVGCITQQDKAAELLRSKFPFVDIVLGTSNFNEFESALIARLETKKPQVSVCDSTVTIGSELPTTRTSYPNAWINIIYGCNNFCTYCIVPYVRGRERSRASVDILSDVQSVLDEGYKEITLLGQNVDSYGSDLAKGENFPALLRDIGKIEGKFRLRFMTSHPKDFSNETVDIISSAKNICNSIHLPVQSGSDNILRAMNRRYTRENYLDIIRNIRKKMPNAGITTDIMVGFPGETEKDYLDTLDLVREARFSNAFTFVYSPRNGTPAAKLPQIPAEVKKERIKELVATQNTITKEISRGYINKIYEVLVEDVNSKYENTVCGRTDCGRLVTFNGTPDLIGKFENVKITEARSASLFGKRSDIV